MDKRGKLNIFTDHRGGNLIPLHLDSLDFDVKRIFTVSDVPPGQIRGEHAHYETKQVLLCVRGKIIVNLDYGTHYEVLQIESGEWIYIDKMVWDSQKFVTGNEFMVVFCSTEYDISDYILNKEEFYKIVNQR
jgi:dTDP-4-dehydrorhamnose 3,5-epimerase-like enzyme